MMRYNCFLLTAICFALVAQSTNLQADQITRFADLQGFEDEEFNWEFNFLETVLSIDSISMELSHGNAEQLQIQFENIGVGNPFALFSLVSGDNVSSGNTVGVDDGNFGDLNGLSTVRFVEFGAATTVRNAGDEAPSGDYFAEDWENHLGSGNPPYEPSRWRFSIADTSSAGNQVGAIGAIRINFSTAVPEPNAIALLVIGCLAVVARRKRS